MFKAGAVFVHKAWFSQAVHAHMNASSVCLLQLWQWQLQLFVYTEFKMNGFFDLLL